MPAVPDPAGISSSAMLKRYFRVDRRHIAYFRFILEAYEGMATLSTLDAREGIVVLSIPECFAGDADGLLAALAGEIGLVEMEPADRV